MGNDLVVLSVLGGRASVAKRHIELLIESQLNRPGCRFVFYVTHPSNEKLWGLVREVVAGCTRAQAIRKCFSEGESPSGYDHDYDTLLAECSKEEMFLCVHDDTFVCRDLSVDRVSECIADVQLSGYIDHNVTLGDYQSILIDNVPLGNIRIGTWFLCGRGQLPSQIGCGRFFRRNDLLRLGERGRVEVRKAIVWLNGGCLLNIKARMEGIPVALLDKGDVLLAEHVQAGTWDLVKSNLLRFSQFDEVHEAEAAKGRFTKMSADRQVRALEIFRRIVEQYSRLGIQDSVVNSVFLAELMRSSLAVAGKRAVSDVSMCRCRVGDGGQDDGMPTPIRFQIQTTMREISSLGGSSLGGDLDMPMSMFERIAEGIGVLRGREVWLGMWSESVMDQSLWRRLALVRRLAPATKKILTIRGIFFSEDSAKRIGDCGADVVRIMLPSGHPTKYRSSFESPNEGLMDRLRVLRKSIQLSSVPQVFLLVDAISEGDFERTSLFWANEGYECLRLEEGGGDLGVASLPAKRRHMFVYGCRLRRHLDWLHIRCDGSLCLCPNDFAGECFMGTVVDQSLEEIACGDARITYRYRVETGGPDRLPCHRCEYAVCNVDGV